MDDLIRSSNISAGGAADEFCSTKKAANLLKVSSRTVQLWVDNGSLRAWRTAGGHRRITMESINRLLTPRQDAIATLTPPLDTPVPMNVLMVDHDQTMLRLYEVEMHGWNFPIAVTKAFDGFEALIRIGEQRPDLLISDLSLPGMDPGRVVRTLRENSNYTNMAIVLTSDFENCTIQAMNLPRDIAIYTKPLLFASLKEIVKGRLEAVAHVRATSD